MPILEFTHLNRQSQKQPCKLSDIRYTGHFGLLAAIYAGYPIKKPKITIQSHYRGKINLIVAPTLPLLSAVIIPL